MLFLENSKYRDQVAVILAEGGLYKKLKCNRKLSIITTFTPDLWTKIHPFTPIYQRALRTHKASNFDFINKKGVL